MDEAVMHWLYRRRLDRPSDWEGIATVCGVDGPGDEDPDRVTCRECLRIGVERGARL